MDNTPNLKLPFIAAGQAQKHVTHNEAIRALDAVVQLSVLDRHLAAPPSAPAEGDRYIVGPAASGDWATHEADIAAFQDGAWAFFAPVEGWLAWVRDEDRLMVFDGSGWVSATEAVSISLNPATGGLVGVNATADTTNRLAIAAPASLFNHAGAGHQIKVNKAAAANTASLLFQSGFSGRAEFGLAGDDDWRVKVSADGGLWRDAMVADRATGRVRFPSGGVREQLTANRAYFVRADGNDANDGLDNTAGRAFASIQRALDVVGALDLATFTATILVNDGTYAITAALRYRGFQGGQVVLRPTSR